MTRKSGKSLVKVRFNRQKYADLLVDTLSKVKIIETEKQNRRLLKVLRSLMRKGQDRTPEETELAKLLGRLIQEFEIRFYNPRKPSPHEALIGMMEMNHLKSEDFLSVFGSIDIASEVISGNREISKAHAKALGKFFSVKPDLFL
jgi:HTH-type transcriptional regulator / antitoxin HigA